MKASYGWLEYACYRREIPVKNRRWHITNGGKGGWGSDD
jgi:hypothetical protein